MAAQAPSAMLRSRGFVKLVVRIESAAGDIMAAPIPCARRAPMSTPSPCAAPPTSEASANRMSPPRRMRRRPKRSAARPPSKEKAAICEHVAAHHPLQVLRREAQLVVDRRQCDVDDRDVEEVQELHEQEQRERQDAATGPEGGRCCGLGCGRLAHAQPPVRLLSTMETERATEGCTGRVRWDSRTPSPRARRRGRPEVEGGHGLASTENRTLRVAPLGRRRTPRSPRPGRRSSSRRC
jgi:hypothetical protein